MNSIYLTKEILNNFNLIKKNNKLINTKKKAELQTYTTITNLSECISEFDKFQISDINQDDCNLNIHNYFKQTSVGETFKTEILGYHLICESPIKESVWEEINCNIVDKYCNVIKNITGSHLSGRDNIFDNWKISNKTGKIDNNKKIAISSYRLGKVCNIKNVGTTESIITEIIERSKSYDYYSILLRDENKINIITYFWFIIPKNYTVFNNTYKLLPMMGKTEKNKDKQLGWKSKYASISFSMSSQLWFNFNFNDIKQFLLHSVDVNKDSKKYTYSDLYNLS
jgi:hypothetical protein